MLIFLFILFITINAFNYITTPSNCTYGLLTKGIVLYAYDCYNNPIPGSTIITYNGLESIKAFCNMYQKFPNTCTIAFIPKRMTC